MVSDLFETAEKSSGLLAAYDAVVMIFSWIMVVGFSLALPIYYFLSDMTASEILGMGIAVDVAWDFLKVMNLYSILPLSSGILLSTLSQFTHDHAGYSHAFLFAIAVFLAVNNIVSTTFWWTGLCIILAAQWMILIHRLRTH